MKEVVASFGRNGNLQGMVCLPEQHRQDVMLVLLNAGVTHKAGPFRLNVDIARHAATQNVSSFRFDYGGLGDSEKIQSALSHEDAIMQDISDAFDYLEDKYRVKRFVVLGLCTGAEHSHKIALRDERVTGCVWLDGYGYPTPKYYSYRYIPILKSPARLFRLLARMLRVDAIIFGKNNREKNTALAGSNVDDFVWKQPPRNKYIDDMMRLFNRQVRFLYIYTGGVFEYYNYAGQYADAFGKQSFMQNVTVEYFPRANHTYAIENDKQLLLKTVMRWIQNI